MFLGQGPLEKNRCRKFGHKEKVCLAHRCCSKIRPTASGVFSSCVAAFPAMEIRGENQRPLRTPKKGESASGTKNPPNYIPDRNTKFCFSFIGKVDTIPLENEVTWRSVSSLKDFNNNKNRNFPAILDYLCESVSHPYASKTWHASL